MCACFICKQLLSVRKRSLFRESPERYLPIPLPDACRGSASAIRIGAAGLCGRAGGRGSENGRLAGAGEGAGGGYSSASMTRARALLSRLRRVLLAIRRSREARVGRVRRRGRGLAAAAATRA